MRRHQAQHSTPCLTKTAVVMARDLGVHHQYNACLAGGLFVRTSIGWYPLHRVFCPTALCNRLTTHSIIIASADDNGTTVCWVCKITQHLTEIFERPPQQCRCADLHQPIAHLPCHTRQYWELRPLSGSDRRAPLKARALDVGSRPCTGDSGSVLGRRRSRLVGRRRAAT